jgi:hypothetical protein
MRKISKYTKIWKIFTFVYAIKSYSLIFVSKVKMFLFVLYKKTNIHCLSFYSLGQSAWEEKVFSFHQRLYTENLNNKCPNNIGFNNYDHSNVINKNKLYENKDNFFQWLVGFTDGDGCFSISAKTTKNGKKQ